MAAGYLAARLFDCANEGGPVYEVALLTHGDDAPAANGRVFERVNPITGEIATRASAATIEDAESAAASAAAAFPRWSSLGPGERRRRLAAAADEVERRGPEFQAAMADETGATEAWARFNVTLAASMLREAAAMTTAVVGDVIPSDKPGQTGFALRQPVGVVLGLAPWNAPIILGVRALAMPLACGNTTVLKGSEVCPRTHRLVGDAFQAAGCGDGVVNVVNNAPSDASQIVEALIAHPAVRRVNFTGSTRVGRHVAELAARHLKPALLELGGKAPLLVLDDADLDEAVAAAAFGAFMNQGQICMSTERLIVDQAVADPFARRLAAKAASLVAGDPRAARAPLGSMIGLEAVERVVRLVRDAVAKGARLIAGGRANGVLMDATVLDHVTPAMRIYKEESFGPVAAIIRVEGVEEAVRVANDTEYGLAAAVFGRDLTRALSVARRIESGICHINGPTVHDQAQMPFGGVKASGYGRFGGLAAIHEFTELRWVTINAQRGRYPI
jgi:vanillin dehydrogenase